MADVWLTGTVLALAGSKEVHWQCARNGTGALPQICDVMGQERKRDAARHDVQVRTQSPIQDQG